MTTDEDWKSTVRYKLSNVFEDDVQTLSTILSYLDEDDIGDKSTTKAEVWEILTSSLEADDFFESYARSLVQDRILEDTDPDKDSKSLEEVVKSVPDSYEENLAAVNLEDKNEDWNNDVLRKVVDVFKDDRETCANILFNLNKENKIFTGDKLHQVWQTLKDNLTSEEHFKYYARLLVDDIKETEDETVVDVPDILNQLPTDDQEEYFDIEESKATIRSKLLVVFQENPETLERILCYLDKEDVIHQDITRLSQVWESLKSNLHSDNFFMTYARSLVEDEEESFESCKKSGNFGNLEGATSADEDIAFGNGMASGDWKDEVREKLVKVFADDAESLTRTLFYLDEEDKSYKNSTETPPVWRTLKSSCYSDDVFKRYATCLAEDTKNAEKDPQFRETMNLLYTQMMEASEESASIDHCQSFDMVRMADLDVAQKNGFIGLARAWSMIPKETQANILDIIPNIITNKQLVSTVDEVVGLVDKTGGSIVMVALAAIQLTYDVIVNLKRWWKGEITGARCGKNIMDSFLTIGAGVAGGVAGSVIGSLAGPMGTVIGGVIGSVASSAAASTLSDRLTQWLFGVPKSEALENAYRFLGVSMTASNSDINTAYRHLCLKHHPDKPGGSKEDFHFLQLNMGTIKAARDAL